MVLTQKARKFLRQWISDLESGNFRQNRYKLKEKRNKGYNYCCIGVAEVSAKKLGLTKDVIFDECGIPLDSSKIPSGYDILNHFLNSPNPSLINENIRCTTANDIKLWNFTKIAKALRDTYNVRG
jgi:hypothetical protein